MRQANALLKVLGSQSKYLLDEFGGAAAAYSLRRLNTSYSGSAIRVRRSSDNTEQDIGFVAEDLDTASLLSFVGAGSGFVTTWYDQSGEGNHVTQASAAGQPTIVNSGTVITEGGKTAIDFDGIDDGLRTVLNIVHPFTAFSVSYSTIQSTIFDHVSGERSFLRDGGLNSSRIFSGSIINSLTGSNSEYKLIYGLFNSNNSSIGYNGGNLNNGNAGTNGLGSIEVGSGQAFNTMTGKIQEVILFPYNQSSNKLNIELNINNYYNIY